MPQQQRARKEASDWFAGGGEKRKSFPEAHSPFRFECGTRAPRAPRARQSSPSRSTEAWLAALEAALATFAEAASEKQSVFQRLAHLEKTVSELRSEIKKLCGESRVLVPIRSLAAWDLDVTKDIPAVVQRIDDEEYIATFHEANISMSGDTEEEAISNLMAVIAETFEANEEEQDQLGPDLVKQLKTMRDFVRRREDRGPNHNEGTCRQDS